MILITTSRRPTQKMRTFCNDLRNVIPDCCRINRGKQSMERIFEKALELGAENIMIVSRWKGGPVKIELYKLGRGGLGFIPPIIYLASFRTRGEYPKKLRRLKNIVITVSPNSSERIRKTAQTFARFFNLPIIESSPPQYQSSIHFSPDDIYEAKVSVTSPSTERDVGPSFIIRYTDWRGRNE